MIKFLTEVNLLVINFPFSTIDIVLCVWNVQECVTLNLTLSGWLSVMTRGYTTFDIPFETDGSESSKNEFIEFRFRVGKFSR